MNALRQQLEAAAKAFCASPQDLAMVLDSMAQDVERAEAEPLSLFPVIHHSPASAIHMVRYLRLHTPKLVLIEGCTDLRHLVDQLVECELPIALQAYSPNPVDLPISWAPLRVTSPITEFSAEFQAIAYALNTPEVELCFVDRPTDLVFQWIDSTHDPDALVYGDDQVVPPAKEQLPSGQQMLELGRLVPSFSAFRNILLENARMSHFEEWSNFYIEEPTINASTQTYRQVMYLVGSLFRRMGSTPHHREEIRRRDRYMWTQIHEQLERTGVDPTDAVFICGAAHTCNDEVPEWGVASSERYEFPKLTSTHYGYGVVPSSYSSIERQFGYGKGAISLAAARWKKAYKNLNITPFELVKGSSRTKKGTKKLPVMVDPDQLSLDLVLSRPPELSEADSTELIQWCTAVVAEARCANYLATTADAIAIYETSILLARIRGRKRPSAYDFLDAAETCLEKTRVPGRRNIRQCCEKILGADKAGQVGYDAAPPLMRDVYDRLAPLGITARTRGVKRVLMDFDKTPELRDASMLLWCLRQVLPNTRVARPIMGKIELGHKARQESWDVCLSGSEQRAVIELTYSALSVEQVVEKRLKTQAYAEDAVALDALEATEASLILLNHPRLSQSLGEKVSVLLVKERDATSAPMLFGQARRLVYFYRSSGDPMPTWLETLVVTGFHHYCGLLPDGFTDRGTSPEQIAAMCAFLFTLEGLALSLGCERSQVQIAISQATALTTDPEKLGLLWVCEWLLKYKDQHDVRAAFDAVLTHPIGRRAYPRYLSGLLHGVSFAPRAADLAVEQLGRAFQELPDAVLLPWMPALVSVLNRQGGAGLAQVIKIAKRSLPKTLDQLDKWTPSWRKKPEFDQSQEGQPQEGETPLTLSEQASSVRALLLSHREALSDHATAIEVSGAWQTSLTSTSNTAINIDPTTSSRSPRVLAGRELLGTHKSALGRWAQVIGIKDEYQLNNECQLNN